MDLTSFQEGQQLRFNTWIFLLEMMKREYLRSQRVTETDDAYIALGGTEDKTGNIEKSLLRSLCNDYKLNVDLERFISEQDGDGNDSLDFYEFSNMFSALFNKNRKKLLANLRKESDSVGMTDSCNVSQKRTPLVQENQAQALIESVKLPFLMDAESVRAPGVPSHTLSSAGINNNLPWDTKQAQALIENINPALLMGAASGNVPTVPRSSVSSTSSSVLPLRPRPPPGKKGGPMSDTVGVSLMKEIKPLKDFDEGKKTCRACCLERGAPVIPQLVTKMCHPVFNSSAPRLDSRGEIVPLRPAGGLTVQPLTVRPHPRDLQATLEARVVKAGAKRRKPKTSQKCKRSESPVEEWEVYNPFSYAPSVVVTEVPSWKPLELPSLRTLHSSRTHRSENAWKTKLTQPSEARRRKPQ